MVCATPVFAVGLPFGCGSGDGDRPADIDGWEVPRNTVLTPVQYATLAALMDALIPGDVDSPGATQAHAAWYLDQLLGAFGVDPPRIFAGGPYSGRHGGLDGFSQFQPLTRVEALRWRTYIEGSLSIPEREWNGPVTGLIDRYPEGLVTIDEQARSGHGQPFTALNASDRLGLLFEIDTDFLQLVYEHGVEGTYGDPVYGGNFEQRGWMALDFEGDRQPLGYTPRQQSHPEEG